MFKVSLIVATVLILGACSPKTAEVVVVEEKSEFPTVDVAEGNKLYLENCGKCHKFKTIANYDEAQWNKIVPKMAAKAKLDLAQENKILQYVLWEIKK